MNKNEITVLLSSYNGSTYLEEQIDSILNQEGVIVKLIIRDDGSDNNTKDILKKYEILDNIQIYYEKNTGVVGSFLWLIDSAPNSDYYALSDQDDVWYNCKLKRAIDFINLENNNLPQLYAANQNHVDADLKFICKHFNSVPKISLMSEMFRNYISGCTMVFNKEFMGLMRNDKVLRTIAYMRMHDVWMMYLVLIYGNFIYDHEPVMDFRRHGRNVSDGGIISGSFISRMAFKIKDILKGSFNKNNISSRSAEIVLENCRDRLSNKEIYQLDLLVNYRNSISKKIKLLFCFDLFRNVGIPLYVAIPKVIFEIY